MSYFSIPSIAGSLLSFARYRISTFGVRKFIGEVAGIYVIEEVVDLAAEHSEWVKKYEGTITVGLSLGLIARNSFLGYIGRGKGFGNLKILFSKAPILHSFHLTKAWATSIVTNATRNGVTLTRRGQELFKVSVRDGKFAFSHAGIPATAALLAATFGGKIPTTQEEWEITGEQLAVQLADIEFSMADSELRSRLHAFSPVTLISSGTTILNNFLTEYPNFSAERAVSIYSNVLSVEDTVVGSYSLEGFKDQDGDEIIRINGMYYKLTDHGEATTLEPASVSEGLRTPLSDKANEILYLIEATLGKVQYDGGVSLIRVAQTDRFMSTPFSIGKNTLSLVVDIANPVPYFAIGTDSLFDSAIENLEDDFDEQGMEMVARLFSKLPKLFGFEEPSDDEIAFEDKLETALPILGSQYRKGMIFLEAEVLSESLGK